MIMSTNQVNQKYYLRLSRNEVDGDAFLLLSEKQIKELIKAVGPQVKFSQKHKFLCASLSDKDKVAISDHNVV